MMLLLVLLEEFFEILRPLIEFAEIYEGWKLEVIGTAQFLELFNQEWSLMVIKIFYSLHLLVDSDNYKSFSKLLNCRGVHLVMMHSNSKIIIIFIINIRSILFKVSTTILLLFKLDLALLLHLIDICPHFHNWVT